MFARLEEINLYVLFKSFYKVNSLNKYFLFLNYLKTYCDLCEPKWIITSTHYDKKFYELKQIINSNIKFGIVQRSPIFEFHIKNFFNKALINDKKLIIDYFFCFDDFSKKILKNFLSTNFVTIGSFRNNCYPKQKMRESMDILVISGFKEKLITMASKQNHDTDLEQEKKLVQSLILISKKKNLSFKILLKPFTKIDNYTKFNNISDKYCIFNDGFNNYSIIDKFSLLIFPNDSSLRFEVIARKKKFCMTQPYYQLDQDKKNSSCVLKTDLNYDSLLKLINSTINQDYKTFVSENISLVKPVIFDENNNILKSYIKLEKRDPVHVN